MLNEINFDCNDKLRHIFLYLPLLCYRVIALVLPSVRNVVWFFFCCLSGRPQFGGNEVIPRYFIVRSEWTGLNTVHFTFKYWYFSLHISSKFIYHILVRLFVTSRSNYEYLEWIFFMVSLYNVIYVHSHWGKVCPLKIK